MSFGDDVDIEEKLSFDRVRWYIVPEKRIVFCA